MFVGIALAMPATASADATAPLGLTIVTRSDTLLTLDSNKPATSGPNTMFVHFQVTNTSATTYKGLIASVTIADGAVVQLAAGQESAQYLTTLAPGATTDVYWFVTYTRTIGLRTTVSMTVTDGRGNADVATTPLRTSAMISSGTGGTLDAQTLRATYLGMTTSIEVTYIFAGISVGGTYNMQPAGTTSLDAGCFQLVGSQVLASDHPINIPVGATNRMFFVATSSYGGSGARVRMRFDFRVQCLGVTSQVKPYANETSGNTNLKYSSNFDTWTGGTGGITFPTVINPITVAKSATPDSLTDGGTVTYTITLTNSQGGPAVVDSIVDLLPTGVVFDSIAAASGVSVANSASVPIAGATGLLRFRSVPGTYYTVPGNGSLALVFKATIPTPEGSYVNTAVGWVAKTNAGTGTATTIVRRKSDLRVLKTGPDSGRMLDTLAYVIATTNLGPSAADTVVVRDTLPAPLTFLRSSRPATVTGGVVTFAPFLRLPKDSTLRDTVFVTVVDTGMATDIAAATSHALDPVPANSNGSLPASRVTTRLRPELIIVTVTPDGLASPVRRIGGQWYTQDFIVTNGARRPHAFDILAGIQQVAVFVTRDSLRVLADPFNGTGFTAPADSGRLVFGNGVPTAVTVVYSVAPGDTAQGTLRLRARSVAVPAVSDSGHADVRRVRPVLTLAKSVAPDANIVPGMELTYTVQFANSGEWDASAAVVTDDFPPPLAFKVGSAATALPGGLTASTTFSSDAGATWTYAPVSGGCGAPAGYDACVTRIRLVLDGPLPAGTTASSGTLSYVARVP